MENAPKSILIFGGSFDPPHKAHILLLEKAYEALKPSQIIIVPTYRSPFKNFPQVSFEHRKKMLLILLNKSKIKNICKISDFENKRKKVTYTFEVLKHFSKESKNLYFLMGSDSLLNFHRWKNYKVILKMAKLVVGLRKGSDSIKRKYNAIFLEGVFPDISSTNIRREIFLGNFSLLDPDIKKYIMKNDLYNFKFTKKVLKKLKKRAEHTKNVARLSIELAEKHNLPVKKVLYAAFLHDIAKDIPLKKQIKFAKLSGISKAKLEKALKFCPSIIHQWAGKYVALKEFNIKDKEILKAISCHSTGYKNMSKLAKLIYVADFSSYDRDFPEALRVRKEAFLSIEKAFKMAQKFKIDYLRKTGQFIYENN